MSSQSSMHDEQIQNPVVHHEESDINIRGVLQFAVGLTVVAIVIHLLIWGMFRLFEAREAQASTPEYPLAAGEDNALPPEPRLQTMPRQDLRDLRAMEDAILNGYSWVDRQAGVVRIPIGEAMRLAVERGLPARPAAAGAAGTQPPAGNGDTRR